MNNLAICVLSCRPYAERRARCRDTWVGEARQLGIDVVFVVGSPEAARAQRDGEMLVVPAADDYASLPDKVREMCRWALDETDCEWLFKCDDDTYIRSDRLLAVDVRGHDYVGAEWTPGAGYASGGAGYLLSRRAMRIVAKTISQAACEPYPAGAEDLLVGRCLKQAGVPLCIDQRFIAYGDDTRRPLPNNQLISAHACQRPWLVHQVEFQDCAPTVTCRNSGRLGNLLFQVAATVGFARRYGTHRAVFDEASLGRYRSTVFRNLETGATSGEAILAGDAPDFSYNAIPHDPQCNVVICGYMQSEKYFAHCRDEIRELFRPAPAEQRSLEAKYAPLLGPQTIGLHVRRGDYVTKPEYHPLQPVEYYVQAIRHIEERSPVARILCFSDDPGWCQANLGFDPRVQVMAGEPDYLDLALMSMCRHHIIANSAFSWWGAWLNAAPGNIVVAPSRWLGPAFVGWTDRDLVPDGWVRLDAEQAAPTSIHQHGYWCSSERLPDHAFDPQLCATLEAFLRANPGTLADFGCGTGDYVRHLRNVGISCEGYDGNPHTVKLSGGIAQVLDLARRADLGQTFDWVLSLEVGEHIPPNFEATYIDNLHRHNRRGVILSWAVPGQGGHGHCNELENDRVRDKFRSLGYESDKELELTLRESVTVCSWLRQTIMVFRRQSQQPASDRADLSRVPQFPHGLHVREIRRLVGRDDPFILELGCNDGGDSAAFLQEFPHIRLHCFEPDPRPARRFRERICNLRCTLHEAAIGASDGQILLHQSGGAPPDGRMADWDLSSSIRRPTGHLAAHPWCTFDRACTVPMRSLDSWLNEHPEIGVIDLIWADLQGAERDLIAGGQRTLERRTRYLYTEFYNQPMYDGQIDAAEILHRLPAFECIGVYEGYNLLLRNRSLADVARNRQV